MTDLPAYVEFGGLASAPGPLQCDDTTLYVFGLQADRDKMDALCQKVFRAPTGGAVDYRPLGDHVVVTFGVVGAIRPGLEPWHSMGAVREPQVGFWIPVARVKEERDGDLEATHFGMFCAAMMLDNPISLLSGREDYGYPKTMGWSTMPADDLRAPFTLEVFGMDFGTGQAPERRPLLELTPVGDELGEADIVVGDVLSVGEWLKKAIIDDRDDVEIGWRLALDFADALRHHAVDQVFLKQVRATTDGRRADLQQVVVAPAITKNVKARPLKHDYDLVVHHLDSHPLHDELGIAERQRVTLCARMDFDFLIEAGKVEWSA